MTDTPGYLSFVVPPYTANSYKVDYKFETSMMYRAPGGVWVPCALLKWKLNSTASAPWPASPPGVCQMTSFELTNHHPVWNGNHQSEPGQ